MNGTQPVVIDINRYKPEISLTGSFWTQFFQRRASVSTPLIGTFYCQSSRYIFLWAATRLQPSQPSSLKLLIVYPALQPLFAFLLFLTVFFNPNCALWLFFLVCLFVCLTSYSSFQELSIFFLSVSTKHVYDFRTFPLPTWMSLEAMRLLGAFSSSTIIR